MQVGWIRIIWVQINRSEGRTRLSDSALCTSSTIGNYDSLGNPRTYRGMSMEWKNGRELASVTKGGYTYQFAYDSDGNRISKKKTYNQHADIADPVPLQRILLR